MKTTARLATAVASVVFLAAPMRAAEPKPAEKVEKDDKATIAELEAKIKRLEKRIEDLEGQNDRAPSPRDRADNWADWRQRHGFNRDMNDIFDRLQREMERDIGMGSPFLAPRGIPGQKPRLGVELAAPTDELRERFKNDVKDGAFVMSVVPGSPAEKAGLNVGDAITAFEGKHIGTPNEVIDAVKNAPQGKHEIVVARRGEEIKLRVELGERQDADNTDFQNVKPEGGWLRRGDNAPQMGTRSKTEVKASAFEMTDDLAKELKLNDEQKKKMSEVLTKHAKELTDEVAKGSVQKHQRRGNSFSLNMNNDVNKLVEKHADAAAKELTGTLTPEQLKNWEDYRRTHSSISMSQSMIINGGDAGADDTGTLGF